MLSGVKNRLQQWREKKKSPRLISSVVTIDSFRKLALKNKESLMHLHNECKTVLETLNEQQSALAAIGEDTSVVSEKTMRLENSLECLERGIRESEEFSTFLEFTATLNEEIEKNCLMIKSLTVEASTLCLENKNLRTQLQAVQEHFESAEVKCAQLEVEIEQLKFTSTLPDWKPFFEEDTSESTDGMKCKKSNLTLPYLEEEDSLDYADFCISTIINSHTSDKKLKILFELITSYIRDKAYEIAIPLLKTSLEDLIAKYDPQGKTVCLMMEAMAIIYNITNRYNNAIDIQNKILEIKKNSVNCDKKSLANTLSSLTILQGKVGNFKLARNICRKVLDLKYEIYDASHAEIAKELHNLGILFVNEGKYRKSMDYIVQAKNIFQLSKETTNVWEARCSSNLAHIWVELGNVSEATKILQSVITDLHKYLDKTLEGKNVIKEDLLANESKVEEIPNCENMKEIKRIIQLIGEIQEELNCLSHNHKKLKRQQ